MKEISWKEWLERAPERRCRIDGRPHLRDHDPGTGATVLTPVKLTGSPTLSIDAPITWHFPDLAGGGGG